MALAAVVDSAPQSRSGHLFTFVDDLSANGKAHSDRDRRGGVSELPSMPRTAIGEWSGEAV